MMPQEQAEPECTHKLTFNTKAEAIGAKIALAAQKGINLSVYKCKICGLWHLTSS